MGRWPEADCGECWGGAALASAVSVVAAPQLFFQLNRVTIGAVNWPLQVTGVPQEPNQPGKYL